MTLGAPRAVVTETPEGCVFHLSGAWNLDYVSEMERAAAEIEQTASLEKRKILQFSFDSLAHLDSAGVWLIERLRRHFEASGQKVVFEHVAPAYQAVFERAEKLLPTSWEGEEKKNPLLLQFLSRVGKRVAGIGQDCLAVLNILGHLMFTLTHAFSDLRALRPISIAAHFERSCVGAVPIVCLMSFLIGLIIAQQGGFYLRQFGADVYVVDLVGLLVLREIGVILTAIMVAGRSGSAFTAEIGAMKMREEIDALQVMGLQALQVLALPRLLALILALPILTFLSDLAALFGAGLVSWAYLGINPQTFLTLLKQVIDFQTLILGLIKAPFMALIIGLIACVEGLKVEGSSESLGKRTTSSVVKAIFMVIVIDGVFAIFFAAIGI